MDEIQWKIIFGSLVDSLMRVPSLYYLEVFYHPLTVVFKTRFVTKTAIRWLVDYYFIPDLYFHNASSITANNDLASLRKERYKSALFLFDNMFLSLFVNYSMFFLFFSIAFLVFPKLVRLYMHLLSFILLLAATFLSIRFVLLKQNLFPNDSPKTILPLALLDKLLVNSHLIGSAELHLCVQMVLALTVCYLLRPHRRYLYVVLSTLTLPPFTSLCGLPATELHHIHNFATFLQFSAFIIFIIHNFGSFYEELKSGYRFLRVLAAQLGWLEVPMQIWVRYHLSQQLLIFWLGLFAYRLYSYLSAPGIQDVLQVEAGCLMLLLRCISEACQTPGSIIALCVTVSYVSFLALSLAKMYLYGWAGLQQHNIMHRGWAEGITMMLVALQTDMSAMKNAQRANLMIIVIFIIVSSLLESVHELTNPFLWNLAASQSWSWWKHLRGLALAALLLYAPIKMTFFLTRFFELDFWLCIIVSSCLLTTIQVCSTLTIYSLLMFDQLRSEPSDKSEELVVYIKAVVCVLEFIVALAVVSFGAYESIFGSWNIASALILVVHFYFNVWHRVTSGLKSYRLRRAALKRIEGLHVATPDELARHNDVCSICYAEMREARKTDCGHYFHAACLRKWLNRSSTCPFCQAKVAEPVDREGVPFVPPEDAAPVDVQPEMVPEDEEEDSESSGPASEEMQDTDTSVYDDSDVDLGLYYEGLPPRHRDGESSMSESEEDGEEWGAEYEEWTREEYASQTPEVRLRSVSSKTHDIPGDPSMELVEMDVVEVDLVSRDAHGSGDAPSPQVRRSDLI